jgi:Ca-activated chloride channel family protein
MLAHRLIIVVLAGILLVPTSAPGHPIQDQPIQPSAREVVLTGRITRDDNGQPIAGVQVVIENESRGTVTNRRGVYAFTLPANWEGRTVAVSTAHPAFASTRNEVTLKAGANTLNLSLAFQPVGLQELMVTSSREEAERARMAPATSAILFRDARQDQLAGRYNPNFNTEGYAHIQENVFLPVGSNPLSTFSIDVDKASYANVRRFIHDGTRPPIDAVRILGSMCFLTPIPHRARIRGSRQQC